MRKDMQGKLYIMVLFGILFATQSFSNVIYANDIMFHEFIDEQAVMYRVNSNGSNLTNIGYGMFPQCSPDKKFISYVELRPKISGQQLFPADLGQLIVENKKEKKIIRIKGSSKMGNLHYQHFTIRHCWHPNSKSIAFVAILGPSGDGFIYYYSIKTQETKVIKRFRYKAFSDALWGTTLRWSPDGKYLAFSCPGEPNKPMNWQLFSLTNFQKEVSAALTIEGRLPRFIDSGRILFIKQSAIWTVHTDGTKIKKLLELSSTIMSSTRVVNNKIILQIQSNDKSSEFPFNLYLVDIKTKRLENIKVEDYYFLCPKMSPDGTKITVFGLKPRREEPDIGYYVYNLENRQTSLLKKLIYNDDKGFWWGLYTGYGNSTSWN